MNFRFKKLPKISNFIKIRPVGADLFHAKRRTKGQTWRKDLRFSGILRSIQWQFLTYVSEQTIGPIFRGQKSETIKTPRILGFLTPEDGKRR